MNRLILTVSGIVVVVRSGQVEAEERGHQPIAAVRSQDQCTVLIRVKVSLRPYSDLDLPVDENG